MISSIITFRFLLFHSNFSSGILFCEYLFYTSLRILLAVHQMSPIFDVYFVFTWTYLTTFFMSVLMTATKYDSPFSIKTASGLFCYIPNKEEPPILRGYHHLVRNPAVIHHQLIRSHFTFITQTSDIEDTFSRRFH